MAPEGTTVIREVMRSSLKLLRDFHIKNKYHLADNVYSDLAQRIYLYFCCPSLFVNNGDVKGMQTLEAIMSITWGPASGFFGGIEMLMSSRRPQKPHLSIMRDESTRLHRPLKVCIRIISPYNAALSK